MSTHVTKKEFEVISKRLFEELNLEKSVAGTNVKDGSEFISKGFIVRDPDTKILYTVADIGDKEIDGDIKNSVILVSYDTSGKPRKELMLFDKFKELFKIKGKDKKRDGDKIHGKKQDDKSDN
jgi:hypothetical protein